MILPARRSGFPGRKAGLPADWCHKWVLGEDGESEEWFLERRKQAEQFAVRHVTSNIQVMLERGADLAQAIELLATYTPVFAAGSVEASSFSIEGPSQPQQRGKPRMWPEVRQLSRQADNLQ